MRVTTKIPIEQVTYPKRLPINPKPLLFALKMLQNHTFPPINVQRLDNGQFKLKNGRNRLSAHKLLGRKVILANFAVPEDPRPEKEINHRQEPEHNQPQADGYSLPEEDKLHTEPTPWAEE